MKTIKPDIFNALNERLDTWVEKQGGSIRATIVMVHGFGTDKHETAHYFDDVSTTMIDKNFRVVRFDFSGYGRSEGRQIDASYSKHVGDLNAVLDYARIYSDPIYIFAQSMGCFVVALASPSDIAKTIMTGIPNHSPEYLIKRFISRFQSRQGAKMDLNSISLLPRSTGEVQKIGPQFWRDIESLKPLEIVQSYASKTNLMIVHWNQDEIIGTDFVKEYDKLPGVHSLWLNGNHSVTNPDDRQQFAHHMLDFLNKE